MAGSFDWQAATPESQGLSREKLNNLGEQLAGKRTRAFLIVKGDRVVHEWYAPGQGAQKRHYTASLAKSLVGGLSLTLALQDGRIRLEDPACKYILPWRTDSVRSKITILHLATHSSGIEDADGGQPGWKEAFLKRQRNPFEIARDEAPVLFAPGTQFAYSNPGMAMLAYAVAAAFRGTAYEDARTLLRERIYQPIGLAEEDWQIGYGATYPTDGLNLVPNWSGGEFTARATARIGRLMLRQGDWQGVQVLEAGWAGKSVAYAGTPLQPRTQDHRWPGSGLCWWSNFDEVFAEVPRDAFCGAGAGHQLLLVIPSRDMIVVRNGGPLGDARTMEAFWAETDRHLFRPLMQAVGY